jgi:hypothetical protein
LTVNFSTIIVGRAGEPVSVFNLDAPQLSIEHLNDRQLKTKNDYFREMIAEVLVWGLKPEMEKQR